MGECRIRFNDLLSILFEFRCNPECLTTRSSNHSPLPWTAHSDKLWSLPVVRSHVCALSILAYTLLSTEFRFVFAYCLRHSYRLSFPFPMLNQFRRILFAKIYLIIMINGILEPIIIELTVKKKNCNIVESDNNLDYI